MKIFTSNPDLKHNSLTDEIYRDYVWPNGTLVRIAQPQAIHISTSGGHRILDSNGVSHYIPTGWIHLRWETKEGCPAFTF